MQKVPMTQTGMEILKKKLNNSKKYIRPQIIKEIK